MFPTYKNQSIDLPHKSITQLICTIPINQLTDFYMVGKLVVHGLKFTATTVERHRLEVYS